jgi:signal transduction histidine kinase
MEGPQMTTPPENKDTAEIHPQTVARALRHGVSSLLQTVYATVAILKDRLPPEWEEERRLLAGAHSQAKSCARFLDTVQDLVSPVAVNQEQVDLAELVGRAVEAARTAYPQRNIQENQARAPLIQGDASRLMQTADLLLLHACERAGRQVTVRVTPARQAIEWIIEDDGPPLPADQLQRLFVPFAAPRQGLAEVGLTLAHRLVLLHGGQMEATNRPAGGLRLRVTLPQVEAKNQK